MGATSRVAAGAAYLDEHVPDWVNRIDTSVLSIYSSNKCILGQLFDDYFVGKIELDIDSEECVAYGLAPGDSDPEKLDKAWIKLIESRRATPHVEPEPDKLDMDAFIKEHAESLERMYTNRTAGDHSFVGFVVTVLLDLRDKGVHIPF